MSTSYFKDLILKFKDPLLKSIDTVLGLKEDFPNCKYFSLRLPA